VGVPLQVAQHQRDAVLLGQPAEFLVHNAGVFHGGGVGRVGGQHGVGVDPDAWLRVSDTRLQGDAVSDPVEQPSGGVVAGERPGVAHDQEERHLERVFRRAGVAEHCVAHPPNQVGVAPHQEFERGVVLPGGAPAEQVGVRHSFERGGVSGVQRADQFVAGHRNLSGRPCSPVMIPRTSDRIQENGVPGEGISARVAEGPERRTQVAVHALIAGSRD
jgi:hypothetical protein